MSLSEDAVYIENMRKNTNDVFGAIRTIAASARKMRTQYNGLVSTSEAISCIIRNEVPDISGTSTNTKSSKTPSDIKKHTNEILCYVDDPIVKSYVRDSVYASQKQKHIIYLYPKNCSEEIKSRIRVLTNMIWLPNEPKSIQSLPDNI